MCNKTLVTLMIKRSINCKKLPSNYLYSSYNCYSGLSNLKQITVLPRKFYVPPKNAINKNYVRVDNLKQLMDYGSLSTSEFFVKRYYCSNKQPELPKLMDVPQVIWPSIFKTIRNWILSNFIIMRYFDPEFNLDDFVIGSKQAMETVSGLISKGDVDSLSGLVTPDVMALIRESLETFTLKQRQEFAMKADDVYFAFPYEVGVMFPDESREGKENQSRFVEITMCYHSLQGLKELRNSGGLQSPENLGVMGEFQDKIFVLNYRFIREFTKGVNDEWTINAINHFKPPVQA